MRNIILCCLALILLIGCKKEHTSKVEIYMLTSFTLDIDRGTNPATLTISNTVLADTPLVADEDIIYYEKSSTTFWLRNDIKPIIQNYGADKGFAITVDGEPVYFGVFHPLYLSSIIFGLATISAMPSGSNDLQIDFPMMEGSADLQQLDKRNDPKLLDALKDSRRLK